MVRGELIVVFPYASQTVPIRLTLKTGRMSKTSGKCPISVMKSVQTVASIPSAASTTRLGRRMRMR